MRAPAQNRVHGGSKTSPEARRDSGVAHSIPCSVPPSIQTDCTPENRWSAMYPHVPHSDAERCGS